jgi:hypothetical protein
MRIFKSAAAASAVLVLLLVVACGGGGPEQRTFRVELRQGIPVGGVKTFKSVQGDTVTLVYKSDTAAEFHLHGYDREVEVRAGEERAVTLVVDATGRFEIEVEDTKTPVGYLEVLPR